MERIQLIITGRVQGVLFRSSAASEAQKLGLTGWVRNRSDGAVEIVAEGRKESLEELVSWAKAGPDFARVEDVKVAWERATSEFSGFEIE